MRKIFSIIVLAGALFVAQSVFAQIANPVTQTTQDAGSSLGSEESSLDLSKYGYTDLINMAATPQYPKPGDTVTVQIDSNTADLDRSDITWTVNGTVVAKQVGLKSYTFTAGALGQKSVVAVTVDTPIGTTDTQSLTIVPSQIDMIWQTDTYTPPFYEGKAAYTTQSTLEVIAMPHIIVGGKEVDPKNLIYTWKQDGQTLGDQSGYGKNTLTITKTDLPRPTLVQVVVTTYDSSITAEGEVTVTPIPPKALVYVDHPRYGILDNQAIAGSADLDGQEIDLVAYPYFFSTNSSDQDVSYQWETGGNTVNGVTGNSIIFRNDIGDSGRSAISLSVKQTNKILQFATTEFQLNFTKQNDASTSPF